LPMPGCGDQRDRVAMLRVHTPAAGAGIVGWMGHLLAAPRWAMPPVLNTRSGTAL
jgi:hypothetical protein